jgi:UDP-N-acetylmuramate dehydrogenase
MTKLEIERDVSLAPLTSLELGGPAKYFVRVRDEATLIQALHWSADRETPFAILAGGSNLIVPDEGYEGLVVQMSIDTLDFHEGGTVSAGAGVAWEKVVDGAVARSWAGLECLAGIPGSAGATPIQNVGAYGAEVADTITRVRVIRCDTLEPEELAPQQCGFGYRDSSFKREPGRFIVSAVDFALRPNGPGTVRYAELANKIGPGATLAEIRRTVLELRRQKSMLIEADDPDRRSAGSFFLNPRVCSADADRLVEQALSEKLVRHSEEVPRYPVEGDGVKLAAGWLIEKAGVPKGSRRGAIGVSSKHALALVHHGGGTTAELLAFADEIRARVLDRFGVALEREPRLLA